MESSDFNPSVMRENTVVSGAPKRFGRHCNGDEQGSSSQDHGGGHRHSERAPNETPRMPGPAEWMRCVRAGHVHIQGPGSF